MSLAPQLGPEPFVAADSVVADSVLGAWCEIGPGCHVSATVMGDYSYLAGANEVVHTDIGRFCSIASHVRLNPGNHPRWRVTQHHLTYRRRKYGLGDDDAEFLRWRSDHKVTIGHDVWIGHAAVVMPGITIGNGAVVGAQAVVTRDVAPYEMVVGVPARPLGQRFDAPTVAALEASAWWEWTREELESRFDELLDVTGFVKRFG